MLARFVGRGPTACPGGENFCSLRADAGTAGAHAIWVRKTETDRHPGDWIMATGRLIRIYPVTINACQGRFIRYAAS